MANQRIFLWAALALVLWFNYDAWQRDYAPPAPSATAPSETPGAAPSAVPPPSTLDEVPKPASTDAAPAPAPTEPAAAVAEPTVEAGNDIRVLTDVLDLRIGLQGGELQRADLLDYPKDKHHPDVLVRLFNDDPAHQFVFRSGLTSGSPGAQPDHLATFTAPSRASFDWPTAPPKSRCPSPGRMGRD